MPLATDASAFLAKRANMNGTTYKAADKAPAFKAIAQIKNPAEHYETPANNHKADVQVAKVPDVDHEADGPTQLPRQQQGTAAMNAMSSQISFEEAVKKELRQLGDRMKKLETDRSKGTIDTAKPDFVKDGFSVLLKSKDASIQTPQPSTSAVIMPAWKPVGVRKMPVLGETSLHQKPLELSNMTSFPRDFLTSTLGGKEWSPGLWHTLDKHRHLPSKTYYILDATLQPHVPTQPGEHGALLTVFFHDFAKHQGQHDNVPLFVRLDADVNLYTYLGTYSQTRWSDRLDVDRIADSIPYGVKQHWADRLTRSDREDWETAALKEYFVPKPTYTGELPSSKTDDKNNVNIDISDFIDDLVEWQQEATEFVAGLTRDKVLEAFGNADAAEVPGLRFWWEYLQCVSFDRNFYYELVSKLKMETGGAQAGEE